MATNWTTERILLRRGWQDETGHERKRRGIVGSYYIPPTEPVRQPLAALVTATSDGWKATASGCRAEHYATLDEAKLAAVRMAWRRWDRIAERADMHARSRWEP